MIVAQPIQQFILIWKEKLGIVLSAAPLRSGTQKQRWMKLEKSLHFITNIAETLNDNQWSTNIIKNRTIQKWGHMGVASNSSMEGT